MNRYQEISKEIFSIYQQFTPLVEPISLDEAFLDVTRSSRLFGPPEKIARDIKKIVAEQTGLTVSAGVAGSKLVAKIASDFKKPDGLTVVEKGREKKFLAPLPIARLWGVGKVSQKIMALLSVSTIGDLRKLPLELLENKFGKQGHVLYYSCRGIDDRAVSPCRETKSIGNEETFKTDLILLDSIQRELLFLADKVAKRLRGYNVTGKRITLKVKYNDFKQVTRSKTISQPTNDSKEIVRLVMMLLKKTAAGTKPVRLLGISLSLLHLADKTQITLFPEAANRLKRQELNEALDQINDKFGTHAILPGRLLR